MTQMMVRLLVTQVDKRLNTPYLPGASIGIVPILRIGITVNSAGVP